MRKIEMKPAPQPDEVSLSPEVEQLRRKLMRLMLVVLVITFLLVGVVLVAALYKATQSSTRISPQSMAAASPAASTSSVSAMAHRLVLDFGERLVSYRGDGDILILETVDLEGRTGFIFYDYRQGVRIARLTVSANLGQENGG